MKKIVKKNKKKNNKKKKVKPFKIEKIIKQIEKIIKQIEKKKTLAKIRLKIPTTKKNFTPIHDGSIY